jgi:hypothetical protein
LGERIVNELGLADGVDTLGRWMSHRLAEQIARAEEATSPEMREAAQREAADLILRLWERRERWPRGYPAASLVTLVREAFDPGGEGHAPDNQEPLSEEGAAWLRALYLLRRLHDDERRTCRTAAVADLPIDKESSWLQHFETSLSTDEADLLRRIIEAKAGGVSLRHLPAPGSIKALRKIHTERKKIIDHLAKSLEESKRTANSAGRHRRSPRTRNRRSRGSGAKRPT